MKPEELADSELARATQRPVSRVWMWLYGDANLWGSAAGLAGVALFFAGLIGPGWLAIVAGLYAIGAVAAPRRRAPDFSLPGGFTVEDAARRFDEMLAALKAAAGAEVLERLASIREHALALLPKQASLALTEEDRYTLRELLARYLPETLANYFKLPPLYRRYHPVREGKTAEKLLAEQLGVLDGQLDSMMDRVFRAEAQDLLTQGRFLEDKFKRPDLIDHRTTGERT